MRKLQLLILNNKSPQSGKKINALTIILINALLPLINTLYPTHQGVMFSLGLSFFVVLLSGYYVKAFKAGGFVLLFYSLYIVSMIYLKNTILTSLFRMSFLFLPCFLLAWVLCTEYNSSELLSALQRLHLPKLFIIGLMVTLRYMATFRKEFQLIKDAMKVRGVEFSFKYPIRTFEYLVVPQLFRCLTLSNELTSASLTKGITAPCKRTSYFAQKLSLYDFSVFAVLILGYGMIIGGVV